MIDGVVVFCLGWLACGVALGVVLCRSTRTFFFDDPFLAFEAPDTICVLPFEDFFRRGGQTQRASVEL